MEVGRDSRDDFDGDLEGRTGKKEARVRSWMKLALFDLGFLPARPNSREERENSP